MRSIVQKWAAIVAIAVGVGLVSVPAALVVVGLVVLADAVTPARGV